MTRTLIAGAILLLGSVGAQAQTGLTSEMTRVIGALNLREVVIHPDNWGPDITATLPGGARIELDFHRRGSPLEEIESAQNQPFPATEIAALVPEAVRTNPNYPSDGTFDWSLGACGAHQFRRLVKASEACEACDRNNIIVQPVRSELRNGSHAFNRVRCCSRFTSTFKKTF